MDLLIDFFLVKLAPAADEDPKGVQAMSYEIVFEKQWKVWNDFVLENNRKTKLSLIINLSNFAIFQNQVACQVLI